MFSPYILFIRLVSKLFNMDVLVSVFSNLEIKIEKMRLKII